MLKKLGAILVLALALGGCSPDLSKTSSELTVSDAWVRVSEYSDHIGGMTGVFAKFTNTTDHDITITGGSSDIADMVETHEVVMVKGAMKMQKKAGGIKIASGETVTLEPGGLHVMLMGLRKPIQVGDKITVTLLFDGAKSLTLTIPAKTSLSGDESYNPSPTPSH